MFPPDRYPYPDDDVRARWRRFGGRVLLARRDGHAAGLAALEGPWLHGFYVVPAEWGRGVADALHTAAVDAIAAAHGEGRLWCLEQNLRARRFYEVRGWTLNGETRVVPFPPHPLDLGYSFELPRIASSAAS